MCSRAHLDLCEQIMSYVCKNKAIRFSKEKRKRKKQIAYIISRQVNILHLLSVKTKCFSFMSSCNGLILMLYMLNSCLTST